MPNSAQYIDAILFRLPSHASLQFLAANINTQYRYIGWVCDAGFLRPPRDMRASPRPGMAFAGWSKSTATERVKSRSQLFLKQFQKDAIKKCGQCFTILVRASNPGRVEMKKPIVSNVTDCNIVRSVLDIWSKGLITGTARGEVEYPLDCPVPECATRCNLQRGPLRMQVIHRTEYSLTDSTNATLVRLRTCSCRRIPKGTKIFESYQSKKEAFIVTFSRG